MNGASVNCIQKTYVSLYKTICHWWFKWSLLANHCCRLDIYQIKVRKSLLESSWGGQIWDASEIKGFIYELRPLKKLSFIFQITIPYSYKRITNQWFPYLWQINYRVKFKKIAVCCRSPVLRYHSEPLCSGNGHFNLGPLTHAISINRILTTITLSLFYPSCGQWWFFSEDVKTAINYITLMSNVWCTGHFILYLVRMKYSVTIILINVGALWYTGVLTWTLQARMCCLQLLH